MNPATPQHLTHRIAVTVLATAIAAVALVGGILTGSVVNRAPVKAETPTAPVSQCVVMCDVDSGSGGNVGAPPAPGAVGTGGGGGGGHVE